MPGPERDWILGRIAELESTLRDTRSDDVREVLQQALADCLRRLAELNAELGFENGQPE